MRGQKDVFFCLRRFGRCCANSFLVLEICLYLFMTSRCISLNIGDDQCRAFLSERRLVTERYRLGSICHFYKFDISVLFSFVHVSRSKERRCKLYTVCGLARDGAFSEV
jgi:hypothetical protein